MLTSVLKLASYQEEMKWILLFYIFLGSTAAAADIDIFAKYKMDPESLGLGASWMLIADVDASVTCPDGWDRAEVNETYFCQATSNDAGCYSAYFDIPSETPFIKMMGFVIGYQKGTTDGFEGSQHNAHGINGPYVDGVSITLQQPPYYPRTHVWTYAIGYSKYLSAPNNNCPCAVTPGPDPPSFVGEHYYCQSGSASFPHNDTYYTDAPLYLGVDCNNDKDNCCANVGLPFFFRRFPTPLQYKQVEVRICTNEEFPEEAALVEALMLFIK